AYGYPLFLGQAGLGCSIQDSLFLLAFQCSAWRIAIICATELNENKSHSLEFVTTILIMINNANDN
ncbi:hypothetical protein, partial [Vibrio sp. 10N.222.49.C9]|uniref:hypothetical protein n=1 Tax=Vibrio sp. 10N.222.49.C9 TaxID=3229615 RepID=UPI00354FD41F